MSFNGGIKKIEELYSLQHILTTDAQRLLVKLIQDLNDKLIEQCLNKFKPGNKDGVMKADVAVYAVRHLFRDDLRDCAIAEGNKALLRYNSGLLCYTPKMSAAVTEKGRRKAERGKKPSSAVFLKGIRDIRGLIFPNASLQPDALELISEMLGDVSTKISDGAKDSAQQGQTITLNDVRSALDNILPTELRKHAQTEGAKMVFFLESGGLAVVRKLAAKSVAKTPDKRKRASLKRKKPSAIPAKKYRRAKVPKSPRVRRKRKVTPKLKKRAASPRRKKAPARRKPRKSVVVSKKKLPSVSKKRLPSRRKRKRSPVSKAKVRVTPTRKKVPYVSPRRRKPRSVPKKIKRPSRVKRSVSEKKILPTAPSKTRKPSVKTTKAEPPLTRKKRPSVVSRKKRSPAVSKKIRKPPISRKSRAPSKSPVSRRRAVSVSRKKRTPSKRPVSKRREVSVTRKKRAPSKRPVSKRRVSVARKKRTPSKRPVSKRRAMSVTRKKRTPFKYPVSKRRVLPVVRKKRAPSKRPVSERRAVSVSRKKRTPSKRPVSKGRAVSVARKRRKVSKSPVSKKRRSPSASRKKMTPTEPTKTRIKKVKEVSTAGPVAGLNESIKNLNVNFNQSLSSGAIQLINSNLLSLLDRLIAEIKKGKSSTVGAQEVSAAVKKVFPPELRGLAMGNLSKALVRFQSGI